MAIKAEVDYQRLVSCAERLYSFRIELIGSMFDLQATVGCCSIDPSIEAAAGHFNLRRSNCGGSSFVGRDSIAAN